MSKYQGKNLPKDSWVHFTEVNFHDKYTMQFHIDTRDFHVSYQDKAKPIDISKIVNYGKRFFFTDNEIDALIDRLYLESGGKGECRMLCIDNPYTSTSNWQLKYLRITRTEFGLIVCDSSGKALRRDVFDYPVVQQYLNHH